MRRQRIGWHNNGTAIFYCDGGGGGECRWRWCRLLRGARKGQRGDPPPREERPREGAGGASLGREARRGRRRAGEGGGEGEREGSGRGEARWRRRRGRKKQFVRRLRRKWAAPLIASSETFLRVCHSQDGNGENGNMAASSCLRMNI